MTEAMAYAGPGTGMWLFRQDWTFTTVPDFGDIRVYAKALLVAAKGDGVLAQEERDWVLGYIAVLAGGNQDLLRELAEYPADEDVVALLESSQVLTRVARVPLVFDALRACDADGVIAPGELEQIKRLAAALGIAEETVDRLLEVHRREKEAHAARIAAIFPEGTPF
ncbi:hypothetical protein HHL19_18555 [Streptomyces sp. R302]|uniref:hypothetical protein n=1 Tax=unclassified Streptomyces TaxID=2593676 RepID=UPI00145E8B5B|nr:MULTISPECIES: hypothetical protein [unclassified Streptomyces]NML52455.1 hypothetical protein [Streptomyces sp. R301]NML80616.1 hypothetical protein [Streptomyces sp. R302]